MPHHYLTFDPLIRFEKYYLLVMSKRKAPQGDNPNKDIADILVGEWIYTPGISIAPVLYTVECL